MTTVRDVFRSKAFLEGVAQSALWVALGVILVCQVPSFEKIFKDFGYGELPGLTVTVLHVGNILVYYWHLGLLPILLWPFVSWGVLQLASSHPILQHLWRVATWMLPFLCAAIAALALLRPLIVLIVPLQH
jgi:hypothetical protein